MSQYYTYAYLRKNKTPYYIGKGKMRNGRPYRMTAHHNNIPIPYDKERRLLLKMFDREFDAYKHEMYMIKVFGRIDLGTGILRNRTDGGEGTTNSSEYSRRITSLVHKGKVLSEETRNKIRNTRLKRKIKCSDELKKRYSVMFSGSNNPNYGKKHSAETLAKISEKTKNKNLKTRYYITPEGNPIVVENLREFCDKNKFHYGSMIAVYNDRLYSYKGYTKQNGKLEKPIPNKTKRKPMSEEQKKILKKEKTKYRYTLTDPSGNIFNPSDLKDFCFDRNLCPISIRKVCRGLQRHHKEWKAIREPIL